MLLSLFSCSLVARKTIESDEKESGATASGATVPIEQYEELRQRYEQLSYQMNDLTGNRPEDLDSDEARSLRHELNQIETDMIGISLPASRLEEGAAEATSRPRIRTQELTESRPRVSPAPHVQNQAANQEVESEIKKLRRAQELLQRGEFDQASTLLSELERSPVRQVRARAVFTKGEIFFSQGQYDLAMQVYEGLLRREAFSGLTIQVLGRLIVCTENLGLEQKRDRYHSLLHDFFES